MRVLECIEKNGNGVYHLYKTQKVALDTFDRDTIYYDDKAVSHSKKSEFAETDKSRVKVVRVSDDLIQNVSPIFSYFLDGSRHIYKVDDISIGGKIYPIMAGQIIVGCCERIDRDTFKKAEFYRELVIAVPEEFDTENDDPEDIKNFLRLKCDEINEAIQSIKYVEEHKIRFEKIITYKTSNKQTLDSDRDFYKSRATSVIQTEMTDAEQIMVAGLCKKNRLDDEHFLIKDGSLEYTPRKALKSSIQVGLLQSNYKHVVGVSKLFNPELLKDFEGRMLSQTIALLRPFERTKVYRYKSEITHSMYAVWYLRLRKDYPRETNYSDVVKCEMLLSDGESLQTEFVDIISANLIKEAYPVCFGNDFRWANHLYPIYLTESFCKSNYIDSNIFINLF